MAGYIGVRAKKRKRNLIFIISSIFLLIIFFYILPKIKLNDNLPSNSLLPLENEINSVSIDTTIEELELQIFDKQQKILFRNKEIEKLKKEIKIVNDKNKDLLTLSESLKLEVNKEGNSFKKENANLSIQLKKINMEVKELSKIIEDFKNERKLLVKKINGLDIKNKKLKKNNEFFLNENEKFLIEIGNLKKMLDELQRKIIEQDLIIKSLKKSPHG